MNPSNKIPEDKKLKQLIYQLQNLRIKKLYEKEKTFVPWYKADKKIKGKTDEHFLNGSQMLNTSKPFPFSKTFTPNNTSPNKLLQIHPKQA